jgi:predicted amidohydrolase YtcJ
VPLDSLITGRIATLAGEAGFGWVEAVGIRDGRIAFAGTEVDLETRADPHTERIALAPDEVAIPGLTDAHLHLAECAVAAGQVDLTDAPNVAEGLSRIAAPAWPTRTRGSKGRAGTRIAGGGQRRRTSRRWRPVAAARYGRTITTRCRQARRRCGRRRRSRRPTRRGA